MVWTEPDRLVVEIAGALEPGRVLDIGAGDGHDSLWLADHGWSATAVDLSRHNVRKINTLAAERGLDVSAVQADAVSLDYDAEFDLALVCYIHTPPDTRTGILASAVRALKIGGTLLWRSFEASMPQVPGFDRDLLPACDVLLAELGDAVKVVHADVADEYFPFTESDMRLLTVRAVRR